MKKIKIRCEFCKRKFELRKEKTYFFEEIRYGNKIDDITVRIKDKYRAMDCPFCGKQIIVGKIRPITQKIVHLDNRNNFSDQVNTNTFSIIRD